MGYIYCVTNLVNNKKYIGQTLRSLRQRLTEHKNSYSSKLYQAIKLYGIDNFKIEILEETNDLDYKEYYWIKKLGTSINGYNTVLPIRKSMNWQLVEQLRWQYFNENYTINQLATNYGISTLSVNRIIDYLIW